MTSDPFTKTTIFVDMQVFTASIIQMKEGWITPDTSKQSISTLIKYTGTSTLRLVDQYVQEALQNIPTTLSQYRHLDHGNKILLFKLAKQVLNHHVANRKTPGSCKEKNETIANLTKLFIQFDGYSKSLDKVLNFITPKYTSPLSEKVMRLVLEACEVVECIPVLYRDLPLNVQHKFIETTELFIKASISPDKIINEKDLYSRITCLFTQKLADESLLNPPLHPMDPKAKQHPRSTPDSKEKLEKGFKKFIDLFNPQKTDIQSSDWEIIPSDQVAKKKQVIEHYAYVISCLFKKYFPLFIKIEKTPTLNLVLSDLINTVDAYTPNFIEKAFFHPVRAISAYEKKLFNELLHSIAQYFEDYNNNLLEKKFIKKYLETSHLQTLDDAQVGKVLSEILCEIMLSLLYDPLKDDEEPDTNQILYVHFLAYFIIYLIDCTLTPENFHFAIDRILSFVVKNESQESSPQAFSPEDKKFSEQLAVPSNRIIQELIKMTDSKAHWVLSLITRLLNKTIGGGIQYIIKEMIESDRSLALPSLLEILFFEKINNPQNSPKEKVNTEDLHEKIFETIYEIIKKENILAAGTVKALLQNACKNVTKELLTILEKPLKQKLLMIYLLESVKNTLQQDIPVEKRPKIL